MNRIIKKLIIPCVLSGILVLGGCAGAAQQASQAQTTAAEVQTTLEQTAQTAETVSEMQSETAETEPNIIETSGSAESEWFSDRDLAGTYDEAEAEKITLTGGSVTISEEGVYIIEGEISDGQIIVEADKTEKVQLVLNGVTVSSSDSAAIYVKSADKVFITLADGSTNVLSTEGEYAVSEDNVDGVIFSKDDLTINGTGTLEISTEYGHGIVGKDDLTITGGTISVESSLSGISANDVLAITGTDITVTSDMDAIHCENDDLTLGNIYIESGTFDLNSKGDGISATGELTIMDGEFKIRTAGGGTDESMKGLKSDGYLTIYGGYFDLETTEDSIHSDSCVTIDGGVFDIYSEDDAVHADGMLTINGGEFDIEALEGMEATYILINDGVINIYGKDDGINAANKSSDYEVAVEINGGDITIDMEAGDTDGIDSNGNIYINGGTIRVNGQSAIDYDGYAEYTGGTIIINGQTVDSIPNQMMGGGFGPGGRR